MKSKCQVFSRIAIIIGIILISCPASANFLIVDGQANIFGAGHATPPAPGGNGAGILPPVYTFDSAPDQVLTFSSVTGSVSYNSGYSWWGPEGYEVWPHAVGFPSCGGISGIVTNSRQFLTGVFLDNFEPTDPAPKGLDFGPSGLTRNFEDVYPEISQLFFIGDGLTDSGKTQRLHVPGAATRLYLGFFDENPYNNLLGSFWDNQGSLIAAFDVSTVPVPSGVWLLGSGLIGLVGIRKMSRS